MPPRAECARAGVSSTPSLMRNRFSPAPSLTVPSGASPMPSAKPRRRASRADELARKIVAAGLGERRNGVRRHAIPRRDADVHARFLALAAEILAPFPRGDGDFRRRIVLRRHADLAIAPEHDRADVRAALQAVHRDDLAAGLADLLRASRACGCDRSSRSRTGAACDRAGGRWPRRSASHRRGCLRIPTSA